ncbi:ABC transporter permease [Actinophytocola algeriensis]|uniref:Putative spermidine/putrescine transport system permease protein n=1 Tax=Actinophytocola algeriensis TaxID=1768010 RepID=A0A7W7Q682_9PSEU|nr:sugar ABC transporter permease [Actinophytocola algeriensis]MBB4907687.1 putative spermidine/putrescine transport system permease protein [Actinophytocola algeriensis]MBE1479717.1 putative spermidine/putrescine transport system permease protein [Actinophytocola algeriensis]
MTVTAPERPSLKHRLAERGVDRTLLLLVPGVLFVVLLFAYPVLYGLQLSFQPAEGGSPFANYSTFFSDPYLADTIWTTLRLAIPAALINVLASIPIAYRLRGRFRGKRFLTTILVVPITLGTVLTAEGLKQYLSPVGWFNRILMALGMDEPMRLVPSWTAVLFSLIITGFPFAFLLTLSYLSGIDPTLEQAAATLGADWRRRFRYITLPLLAPGLAITFCLTFVLAFSVFPSAYLVGLPQGETRVMSIAAYEAAFRDGDYPMGSTIAVIMAVVMLVVIALVLAWRSRLYRGATGGKG